MLKGFFGRKKAKPGESQSSIGLSVAALLVEAARADEHYADEEKALIERALVSHFGIAAADAAALREKAEAAQADAADLYRFTKDAKALSAGAKIALIESLWRIILSDNRKHSFEDALVRRVCGLIYVDDVESGAARQRVEREIGA